MILKKYIVSLLIVSLMVSTMGITINKLYCMCLDRMETSIFEFEEDCPLEKDSCCKKEAKSCCSKDANQQEKPCSKKDATYLKLNSEFEKPNLADLSFTTDPLPQISSFPQLTSAKTLRTEVNLHNFGPTRLYLQYSVFRC